MSDGPGRGHRPGGRLLLPSAGVLTVQDVPANKERALAALIERLGVSPADVAVGGGSAEAGDAADIVVPRPLVAETLARLRLIRRLRAGG